MELLTSVVIVLIVAEITLAGHDGEHHKRTYTMGAQKVLFCPSPKSGPPGPPGPPGLPGRDGRDGRDCPPCNCGSATPLPPTAPPVDPCANTGHSCASTGATPQPPLPQGPPAGEYHPHKRGRASELGDQRDDTSSGDQE